jgi:G6PDH family F420-dependent oxidoreductase
VKIGYKLFAEAFSPKDLVAQAVRAEEAGFDFVEISDHDHPWLFSHEHSGFAWSILGAIAAQTERIELATGVTCPFLRYHPAVVAQAAATTALLCEGRLTWAWGPGSGSTSTWSVAAGRRRASATSCSARPWRSSGCCGRAVTTPTGASI